MTAGLRSVQSPHQPSARRISPVPPSADPARRAVVTGLGAVMPIGNDFETYWRNLRDGVSGVARITAFDPTDFEVKIAAEVKGFRAADHMDAKMARRMSRFIHFAMAAAKEALASAKLDPATLDQDARDRFGVVVNTGGGGIEQIVEGTHVRRDRGPRFVSPFAIPALSGSMAACMLSMEHGITGPVITQVAACASSVIAFNDALRLIATGECDVVLTGGTEAPILEVGVAALGNMGALSKRNEDPTHASRPFDRDRDACVGSSFRLLSAPMLPSAAMPTSRIGASEPPVRTTSHSPVAMSRSASWNAITDVAHAATCVMTGPVMPYSMLSMHAAIEPEREGIANGETNRGPRSRRTRVPSTTCSIPPPPVLTTTPNRSRASWSNVAGSSPADASASFAAAIPKWMKRLIRRAIFASMWSAARKPFTSAAILTSKSVGSKAVIRATPETPSRRFRQYVSKSLPIGMTAPRPVTTARRAGSALGGTGEVLRERVRW